MSLPYVLEQGILVGKVMSDDKTNWKVLIPYTCQFLIGNVRQKLGMFLSVLIFQCQLLIGNVRRTWTTLIGQSKSFGYASVNSS